MNRSAIDSMALTSFIIHIVMLVYLIRDLAKTLTLSANPKQKKIYRYTGNIDVFPRISVSGSYGTKWQVLGFILKHHKTISKVLIESSSQRCATHLVSSFTFTK